MLFSCLCYFLVVTKVSPILVISALKCAMYNIIPCTTVILIFLIDKLLFKENIFETDFPCTHAGGNTHGIWYHWCQLFI